MPSCAKAYTEEPLIFVESVQALTAANQGGPRRTANLGVRAIHEELKPT